jgi:hypothetical protein
MWEIMGAMQGGGEMAFDLRCKTAIEHPNSRITAHQSDRTS